MYVRMYGFLLIDVRMYICSFLIFQGSNTKATLFFDDMVIDGVKPDATSYAIMLELYSR